MLAKKIVIVGGVAGGASAATKARRVSENHEITIFEAGEYVSYANCGIPYFVGDVIHDRAALLLNDPVKFKKRYNVDVRVNHRVIKINREAKSITVSHDGKLQEFNYDNLILAPGAGAILPWKEAAKCRNVSCVKTMPDADQIKGFLAGTAAKKVVVVGAGFIGIEVCEAMLRLGLSVTLVELAPHILPPVDPDFAFEMQAVMEQHGVVVLTGDGVTGFHIEGDCAKSISLASGKKLEADLFLVGLGVRPNIQLAVECGLKTNRGIIVDEFQRTSDPNIYAAGDVCETLNLVTKQRQVMALAGPANKQGRVAGGNAAGTIPPLTYKGSLGTAIVAFKDATLACSGISEARAKELGYDYTVIVMHHDDHATYYPGAMNIMLKLIVDKSSDLILGAQIFGSHGVDKRMDVIATAMYANLKASELGDLDLSYAPQFGSARDPVVQMGLGYEDVKHLDECLISVEDFLKKRGSAMVVDVRRPEEYAEGCVPGAVCIPLEQLRQRLNELPQDGSLFYVYCLAGFRAYLATRILVQKNYKVCNVAGGWNSLKLPLKRLEEKATLSKI